MISINNINGAVILNNREPIELDENTNNTYLEEILGANVGDVTLSHPVTRIVESPGVSR